MNEKSQGVNNLRKILLILLFSTVLSLSFADDIEDYRSFARGRELYTEGNYGEAKIEFEFLLRNFPNSLLFVNKYANYYIGMNYYKLKDYNKARYYLEQAVYLPNEFNDKTGYFRPKRNHFFEYERNYHLAQIYLQLGEEEEGLKHLKFLIKDYYSHSLWDFESKALKQLALYDPYYETLYRVKYENNISLLPSLKEEDLIMVGDFFVSKGLFDNAVNTYTLLLKESDSKDTRLKLLEALTRGKRYEDAVRISTEYLRERPDSAYYYYRGNAYRRRGMTDYALSDFNRVKDGSFFKRARYDTASLHYVKEEYERAIDILRGLSDAGSHTLLINSYLALDMTEEFTSSALAYIKKYPYTDEAAYYRFLLYRTSKNENYLRWIKKYNMNTYYYEVALSINNTAYELKEFPLEAKLKKYRSIVTKLEKLSRLGDSELLKMNFENLNLPEDDKAFEGYLISMIYEEGYFYNQAIKNSRKYSRHISQYSNLLDILYPRYYSSLVEEAARQHNVDSALIYAVIMKESLFSDDIISRSGAYGLMQIILPTARDMKRDVTPEELMVPSINIDLGTRYLKILLDKYKGDVTKTIAAYNGGMGNVDRWSGGGLLDIEAIPFPETKEYTKDVLSNYYKYKRLYD